MPSRVVRHSDSECVLNFYGDLKWQKKMRRGISILLFVVFVSLVEITMGTQRRCMQVAKNPIYMLLWV